MTLQQVQDALEAEFLEKVGDFFSVFVTNAAVDGIPVAEQGFANGLNLTADCLRRANEITALVFAEEHL